MSNDNDNDDAGHSLLVAFPDPSPAFVHGFEAGMIWQRVQSGKEAEIEATTHTDNREVLQRIATASGWDIKFGKTSVEGWDQTEMAKAKSKPAKNNPHGLRLVE